MSQLNATEHRNQSFRAFFAGTRVAVTGAAGTVGKALVRRLLGLEVGELVCLDNDETRLFGLEIEHAGANNFTPLIVDLSNRDKLVQVFDDVDFVIHTAALKHVPFCEKSPSEAINTNIHGVQNVIHAARVNNVRKVLFTSSDKAVNPTNVMGTTKLMGEKLFSAAHAMPTESATLFFSTRFGNVANSAGSVIPLFAAQIARGGPVTVTDPDMTRFIMTIEDSTELLLNSILLAQGGEVFITKMPIIRVGDLAEVMRALLAPALGFEPGDVAITEIGARPGEKVYEELCNSEEVRRTVDYDEWLVVTPAFRQLYDVQTSWFDKGEPIDDIYSSHAGEVMSHTAIEDFLRKPGVLPESVEYRLRG